MIDRDILQDLADLGMSRRHMAELFGCCRPTINDWLRIRGVTTDGQGHRKNDEILGCSGKPPAKLMPSADAVRCSSVWSFAGGVCHASSFAPRQPVIQQVRSF